ncbi:AAA family ATPase [Neoehrlichia mikurensis]|uniref:AAA family ATPase n=1 Tax=Neoehrlichia mikurensis TaxID=89586 RepID=A0A9Q9F3R6_9RICK|nr:AAA family ATPase [Neoehrlichia mikurensis]QXK92083.1 AAA family ATPase [Neoehrlichia mikurensis]QXK92540.1 AAA family ATPase [Neoehrlichia mikurensis]QXK93776.1 AAA family ATPase [Neoehrlichia mikurensis]UTO55248.1 AAA family ATPase [Neoehrlichia mikurensis]UTO56169.1 AAA family ATPase [Neoehrlichia mikurensis]
MKNIIGHETVKKILISNTNVNSWLIHGKRGIGKATLSYAFTKYLTQHDNLETHPDVMVINTDNEELIGIDVIRKMKQFLNFSSIISNYKVAIIDSIDNLTINAMNAMLKVLEEPSDNSIIILISHNIYNIPITIRSRCFVIHLHDLSYDETKQVISINFPNIQLTNEIAYLYLGTPGMITDNIDDEVTLYYNLIEIINHRDLKSINDVINTTVPLYKIERILLTTISEIIKKAVGITTKFNTQFVNCFTQQNINSLLNGYSKIQNIISTSKNIYLEKKATMINIVDTIMHITSY